MMRTGTSKVKVSVTPHVSDRQRRRELVAFAEYCVARLDRELVGCDRWDITIDEAVAVVRAEYGGAGVIAHGSSIDPAFALWDAMCRIEQRLRDARSGRRAA